MFADLAGYLAAFLTTVSFLPQAIKIIKTGHTRDISPVMYMVFNSGVALWLVYGLFLENIPMILANGVTLCFTLTILFLVIKNREN